MADVTGTNGNDTLFFQGVLEQLAATLTNDYTGETVAINDTYNVNTAIYNGMGGTDTLLMTNVNDAIFLLDANNQQTLISVENIVAGNGGDVIDLASTQVTLGNMFINGGAGDDILWGNAGNDTIQGVDGNDRIDGGPGNDIVNGGNGNDIVDGGAGSDTVTGDAGNDTLVYSQSQNVGSSDNYNGGVGVDTLVLKLTAAQDNADAADIAAAQAFIAAHYNDTGSAGPSYTFSSFGLTISNVESISVVITSNNPPVAQEDDFRGQENQTVAGNLLADNGHGAASDPDGDTATAVAATLTTAHGGTVVINTDGTFTYNPAAGFFGSDTFNYTVSDGRGATAAGTADVSVNGPPVAQEDDFGGFRNQTVSGNVLADNGHGADSDPDGNSLSVAAATLTTANGGNVALSADGTFTYTPVQGFTGADSFTYTLSDGNGGTAIVTVDLTLADRAPVAQADNVTVAEDQVLHGNVLADNGTGADSDPDGDPITVTAGTFATAHGGTVVMQANGDFTYTSTPLFRGADSFTYTESDGILQAGATVNITVTPVNHNPVAQEDDFGGFRNQTVSGNVLADNGHGADSDPDGNSLSVAVAALTTAHGGNVALSADGTFTYTPVQGFTGADSFTYTLSDGNGGTATGTVDLTLADRAPVAQDDNVTVAEDQVLHGNVLVANGHGADSDPDGDTITVTAGTFATAHGTVVVHANGDFTYTSTALFHGADSFAYTESDGILQAGATVNITVTPVNHNPVAQEDDFTGSKNQPVTGNVLANNGHGADSDPDGDPLSVLAATLTTANGSHVTLNANGTFTVTPVNGFSGQDSFSYTLLDGQGGAATGTVKVTFSNGAGHGEGNEHVFQCHGGRSFSGDGDNDRFIFDALTQMPSIVKNFNASGDRLDFSQLIHGFNPLQHAIDQYVHATTQGHNTVISVDADGAAHGSHFTQVAVLEGVSHFDVAAALAHGSLIA